MKFQGFKIKKGFQIWALGLILLLQSGRLIALTQPGQDYLMLYVLTMIKSKDLQRNVHNVFTILILSLMVSLLSFSSIVTVNGLQNTSGLHRPGKHG